MLLPPFYTGLSKAGPLNPQRHAKCCPRRQPRWKNVF